MIDSVFKTLEEARLEWIPRKHGNPISSVTLWRWRAMGVAGEKLHTKSVGGTDMVSREQLEDFFRRVQIAKSEQRRLRQQRSNPHTATDSELHAAGLL